MKTIGVSLWDGQVRSGTNARTVMRPVRRAIGKGRELFERAYKQFAPACRAIEEPGIAVVAVDEMTGRAAGLVRLCARPGRPVAAIVGRHDQCDLYLTGNENLALRQMAVVLGPVESWSKGSTRVQYRVLDLRTSDGMVDEEHRVLRGLRAEGPAVLRCGGYTIFILMLGDPTDWPAEASDAWQMLPERVYFDELDACAGGSLPQLRLPRDPSHTSVVYRTQGPRETSPGMRAEGDLAGTLELIGQHRRVTLTVSHDALRDGILLGRYARCDGNEAIDDPSLSRVHALLIQDGNRLLCVDVASCNGTRMAGGEDARVVVIDRDVELELGRATRARWRWLG